VQRGSSPTATWGGAIGTTAFTDTAEQERLLALAEAGPEGIEGRVVSLALLSGYAHESLAQSFEAVTQDGGTQQGDDAP
jgi:hypothetical protein